jgi:AcrR family transcriptional regulator
MPPTRRRSTRDRPAKAPLSERAVVDAALAVLRSEGLEAVSMRRVAAALDTGPASLYVYVPNREGLLRAMQDRIFATVEFETADPARWREQLHALLERLRGALASHPGIAATIVAVSPQGEASLLVLENLLAVLLAGGLPPREAGWAADVLATLVSHAAVETESRAAEDRHQAEDMYRHFASQPPHIFPLITAHAAQLVAGDAEERFRLAVDAVVDGFLARQAG